MGKHLRAETGYKYFLPDEINREYVFSPEVYNLCIKATDKLAELRAFSMFAPDVDFFIQMHVSKEAVDSNKIEGTKTEIDDLFVNENLFVGEKRNEVEEVKNYIKALNYGIKRLSDLPISTRFIKEIHQVLMDGVRGKNKQPGDFRQSQNWIGGVTIEDAHFVPPAHHHIFELMSDLEKFLHYNDSPDLIKAGLVHFQFETIHPFLDGNGRVGRLLIILFLVEKKILSKPVFYISEFFEKNRSLYYQNLDIARDDFGLEKWIKFFLVGVYETADKNLKTLQKIMHLKSESENKILNLGRKSKNAKIILDYLFTTPIININTVVDLTKTSKTASGDLVKDLIKIGILKEINDVKRNRLFSFEEYVNLFEN